jgi:hypothetical protein
LVVAGVLSGLAREAMAVIDVIAPESFLGARS